MPRTELRTAQENETVEKERVLRIKAALAVRQLGYKSLRAFLMEKMTEAIDKSKKPIARLK